MRGHPSRPWLWPVAGLLSLGACAAPPDQLAADEVAPEPADSPREVEPMVGFSWVVADALGAMPRPGLYRAVDDDLAFLADSGVELLVSLTVDPIDPGVAGAHGIAVMHVPVPDFTAPTLDQLDQLMAAVVPMVEAGDRVGVHCTAGKGRTGTVMAAYFVTQGMTPDDALAEIRRLRPGSVETAAQEARIAEFYQAWQAWHGELPPTQPDPDPAEPGPTAPDPAPVD